MGLSCKLNIYMSWSTSELRVRLARCETCLSPPVKFFTDRSKAVLLLWIFYVFSVLRLLCICARLFICALRSPVGKGLTSWLSFVVSNCEFVTFPLVSWVRCGTWLYQFLIFAPLLNFASNQRVEKIFSAWLCISQPLDYKNGYYLKPENWANILSMVVYISTFSFCFIWFFTSHQQSFS